MSFDKVFDLTAGVYWYFYNIIVIVTVVVVVVVVVAVVVVVVVVVLTSTRMIKSMVTGQAPVTLELRNTPGKTQTTQGISIIDYARKYFYWITP